MLEVMKTGRGSLLVLALAIAAPTGFGCKQPASDDKTKDDKASKDDKEKDSKKKKKAADDDDDDSTSAKKKKKAADDDDDDSTSAKKKKAAAADDDDDDTTATAKKKKKALAAGDDDDDSTAPKKKKTALGGPENAKDGIDIVGSYGLRGAGPDGKTYSGSGTVSRIGGEMYNASWLIGGVTYKGIAFRDGDVLSCGWTEQKGGGDNNRDLGVIAFLVKDDGNTLDGVWFEPDETTLGKETLSGGSGSLTGLYQITAGETPTTHKKYTGTVNIALKSGVFNMTWNIGGGTSRGLGIRNGDVLSAAFTDQPHLFGVLQYRITKGGAELTGQWAQSGQATAGTGTETMTKL